MCKRRRTPSISLYCTISVVLSMSQRFVSNAAAPSRPLSDIRHAGFHQASPDDQKQRLYSKMAGEKRQSSGEQAPLRKCISSQEKREEDKSLSIVLDSVQVSRLPFHLKRASMFCSCVDTISGLRSHAEILHPNGIAVPVVSVRNSCNPNHSWSLCANGTVPFKHEAAKEWAGT